MPLLCLIDPHLFLGHWMTRGRGRMHANSKCAVRPPLESVAIRFQSFLCFFAILCAISLHPRFAKSHPSVQVVHVSNAAAIKPAAYLGINATQDTPAICQRRGPSFCGWLQAEK